MSVGLGFGRGGLEKERSLFVSMWRESTEWGEGDKRRRGNMENEGGRAEL